MKSNGKLQPIKKAKKNDKFKVEETNEPLMKLSQDSVDMAYSQELLQTRKQKPNDFDSNISFNYPDNLKLYPEINSSINKSNVRVDLDSNISTVTKNKDNELSSNYPQSDAQLEGTCALPQQEYTFSKPVINKKNGNKQEIEKIQIQKDPNKKLDLHDSDISFNYLDKLKLYPDINSSISKSNAPLDIDSNISAFTNLNKYDELSSNYPQSQDQLRATQTMAPMPPKQKDAFIKKPPKIETKKKIKKIPVDFDELVKEKLIKLKEKRAILQKEYQEKQRVYDEQLSIQRQLIQDKKQMKPMDTNDLQAMLECDSDQSIEIQINRQPVQNQNLTKAKLKQLPTTSNKLISDILRDWDEKQLELHLLDMEIAVIEEVEKKKPKQINYRLKKNAENSKEKGWVGLAGGKNQDDSAKMNEQTKTQTQQFLKQLEERMKFNAKPPIPKKKESNGGGDIFAIDEPNEGDQLLPQLQKQQNSIFDQSLPLDADQDMAPQQRPDSKQQSKAISQMASQQITESKRPSQNVSAIVSQKITGSKKPSQVVSQIGSQKRIESKKVSVLVSQKGKNSDKQLKPDENAKQKFDEIMKKEKEKQKSKKLTELDTFKKMNEREKELKKEREQQALGQNNKALESANQQIEEKRKLLKENKNAQQLGYQEELKERQEQEKLQMKPLLIQLKQLKEENKELQQSYKNVIENKKKTISEIDVLKSSSGIIEIAPDKFMCFNQIPFLDQNKTTADQTMIASQQCSKGQSLVGEQEINALNQETVLEQLIYAIAKQNITLSDLFRLMDKDHDQILTNEEIRTTLPTLNLNLTQTQIQELITIIDKNSDGVLNEDEFINSIEGGLKIQQEFNAIMDGLDIKSGMILEERKLELKFRKEVIIEQIQREKIKKEAIEVEYFKWVKKLSKYMKQNDKQTTKNQENINKMNQQLQDLEQQIKQLQQELFMKTTQYGEIETQIKENIQGLSEQLCSIVAEIIKAKHKMWEKQRESEMLELKLMSKGQWQQQQQENQRAVEKIGSKLSTNLLIKNKGKNKLESQRLQEIILAFKYNKSVLMIQRLCKRFLERKRNLKKYQDYLPLLQKIIKFLNNYKNNVLKSNWNDLQLYCDLKKMAKLDKENEELNSKMKQDLINFQQNTNLKKSDEEDQGLEATQALPEKKQHEKEDYLSRIIENSSNFALILQLQRRIRAQRNTYYTKDLYVSKDQTVDKQLCQKCNSFKCIYICKQCQNGFLCYKCCQTIHLLGNKKQHQFMPLYPSNTVNEQNSKYQNLINQVQSLIDNDDIARMNKYFAKLDKMRSGFIEFEKFKSWITTLFEEFPENAEKIIELIQCKFIATEFELQKNGEPFKTELKYAKFYQFLEILKENGDI